MKDEVKNVLHPFCPAPRHLHGILEDVINLAPASETPHPIGCKKTTHLRGYYLSSAPPHLVPFFTWEIIISTNQLWYYLKAQTEWLLSSWIGETKGSLAKLQMSHIWASLNG